MSATDHLYAVDLHATSRAIIAMFYTVSALASCVLLAVCLGEFTFVSW